MKKSSKLLSEKYYLLAFEIMLVIKAIFSVLETIGGIAAYIVSPRFLYNLAETVTRGELTENPNDVVANYLLREARTLSVDAQNFAAFYLLLHGVVQIWLIIGLYRKRLHYYPIAIAVFALFIIYQIYRYTFTHDLWLWLLTAINLLTIALTWHEYRYLQRKQRKMESEESN